MTSTNFIDYLLFLFYTFLYFRFIKYRASKIKDPTLAKYLISAYWFRVVSSFILSVFILYIAGADATAVFFPEGRHIYHQILEHPSKMDFFLKEWSENSDISAFEEINVSYFYGANYIIIKCIVGLSFISFGNFITTSFLFSLFAFEGAWQLFKFFNLLNPSLKKYTAICFLFLPTYIFWTSGIVKETISIFCLGYITMSFYKITRSFKAIFIHVPTIIILTLFVYNVKGYTVISYLPLLVYYLLMLKLIQSNLNRFFKYFLSICFIALLIGGVSYYVISGDENLNQFQIDAVTQTIESQQTQFLKQADEGTSSFSLGVNLDPSPAGLLKSFPFAIAATFFRPFIWEAKKLTSLISAIESLFFLIATLYVIFKCGVVFFIKKILQDPLIRFCFFFAIIFGFFCGISTLNFGSLIRYKLPCIPFYAYALLLIYLSKKKVYLNAKEAIILNPAL
jgi:hypothetical protein